MTINKILCPTDFGNAANNAVEYAAQFAKKVGATLTLMHVEPATVLLVADMNRSLTTPTLELKSRQLEDQCAEINKTFKIVCNYDLDQTSLENAVLLKTSGEHAYDLIVAGTNGMDNFFQFYFGTNSYYVAKDAACPTLIIPEGCEYKDITDIAFASVYHEGEELLLQQLKDFIGIFNPHLYVLHISRNESPVGEEIYRSFCNLIEETLDNNGQIEFKRVVNEDEVEGINSFTDKTKIDLLAMSADHHGFLYRLFHKDIIKNITSVSNQPVLIFHK
ncbi:MAG: universal stress protein [Bacteroidota bacterium]